MEDRAFTVFWDTVASGIRAAIIKGFGCKLAVNLCYGDTRFLARAARDSVAEEQNAAAAGLTNNQRP
jgi:hypothetical protein